MATSQLPLSKLYHACRSNDIELVKSHLKTMTPDEIDKLQPNGSTALHVASYYGHCEIVQLLLENGASRSIRNKYNFIPYEESKTDAIKELFSRGNADDRFAGDLNDEIEWIRVGEHIDQKAKAVQKMLKAYSAEDPKKKKKITIQMIDLGSYKDMDKIQRYFDRANEKNDPTYLVTAYTENTEFYRRLNRALASVYELNPTNENQRQLLDFLNLICCHPTFHKYEFQGETYRGILIDADDLEQYQIGAKIMTKSFTSTSKVRSIAEHFASTKEANADGNTTKRACICKYKIRKAHTALSIEDLSIYPHEQEVLIIPYSAFQVVNIQEITRDDGVLTEIELRQCKSYVQTYTALAVGGSLFASAIGVLANLIINDGESEDCFQNFDFN